MTTVTTRSPKQSNVSPLQLFSSLPASEQASLLANLPDDAKAQLAYRWDGWQARPDQLPPVGGWRFWLVMAGRGFGKTRVGAEEIRKAAKRLEFPNIIGATADDARDIMIEGESGILAVCPPWERPDYRPSKRQLIWPSGAKTLIFTADEPERLRGKQHMWLWADEVAAWRYPEAWDQAMLGLRLGDNPQAVVTTTPKPTPLVRELIANPYTRVTRGSTYDNIQNLAPAFADEIIRKYEGTRLGRQELLGELLEDEGLAYRFSEALHVVDPFEVPDSWDRFESMDYGSSDTSATAWLAYAVDYDGNVVIFDELYQPGLPSVTAPLVHDRRKKWYPDGSERKRSPVCYADPAIFNPGQTSDGWGAPAVVNNEFAALGIHLVKANNDRRAGYVRIAELLKLDEKRSRPAWAPGEGPSPTLFVMSHCGQVIQQLKEAPLEEDAQGPYKGPYPGEAVAKGWEANHGHAHASTRYGLLSWPRPSRKPDEPLDDPRAEFLRQYEKERAEQADRKTAARRSYAWT